MEHKTFISSLSRQSGKNTDEIVSLTDALTDAIGKSLSRLDAVAIPGFGRFDADKHAEYVGIDPSDGQKKLFPPKIELSFTPGTKLKKRLSHE